MSNTYAIPSNYIQVSDECYWKLQGYIMEGCFKQFNLLNLPNMYRRDPWGTVFFWKCICPVESMISHECGKDGYRCLDSLEILDRFDVSPDVYPDYVENYEAQNAYEVEFELKNKYRTSTISKEDIDNYYNQLEEQRKLQEDQDNENSSGGDVKVKFSLDDDEDNIALTETEIARLRSKKQGTPSKLKIHKRQDNKNKE